jgi:hypothetical protein
VAEAAPPVAAALIVIVEVPIAVTVVPRGTLACVIMSPNAIPVIEEGVAVVLLLAVVRVPVHAAVPVHEEHAKEKSESLPTPL